MKSILKRDHCRPTVDRQMYKTKKQFSNPVLCRQLDENKIKNCAMKAYDII